MKTSKNHFYWKSLFKLFLVVVIAIVIPTSCGGGGSDDGPEPIPTPTPTPEPVSDVTGLDNLKLIGLKVDTESDLLSGITFNNGAELVKTQFVFEGVTTVIDDPHHFVPAYPGTCTIILTVKSKDGTTTDYKAENKTIYPLTYYDITFAVVDIIKETYPWYNNLQQSTKDFIYPHLLASYAACNWSRQENRVYIIMGETADTDDIENIGQFYDPSEHAYEAYYRIRALCPNTPIKGCYDYWFNLEKYINQHPDNFFLVSCAVDAGGGNSWEKMNKNENTAPQRRMLESENFFLIVANTNRGDKSWKVYCENVKDGTRYSSASINSKLNNKITVVGYNSWGEDNYFAPIEYGGLNSAMPVGYDIAKGNIVMPMISLITNGKETYTTRSSFPTAVTSAIIGNAVSVVMANHPGITPEDAMTIIVNQYLREETFQYMDETTNDQLADGGQWYFIEMQQLLDNELLQATLLNNLQLNVDEVELPSGKGLYYTGKGVQFEYEGQRFDTTKANLDLLTEAMKSGSAKWFWNKDRFRKYGGATTATLKVGILDCNLNSIPDIQLEVTKNIQ